ncbi:hypothetical protein AQ903_10520 [Burkholderia pseudomallei]|nr:hypothetical protein AQ903_10520 [Burkholderia pseudomallei]
MSHGFAMTTPTIRMSRPHFVRSAASGAARRAGAARARASDAAAPASRASRAAAAARPAVTA